MKIQSLRATIKPFFFPGTFAFLALFLFASYTLPLAGQTVILPAVNNRVGTVDESNLQVLHGQVHPLARAEFDQGVVDDSLPVEHLIVVLQPSPEQDAAAAVLVDQLHNRNSSQFHKWMTPEAFGKHFGPSDADLQKLTNWLQSKGFTIEDVPPGRTHLVISGTAGQLRKAFHTELHHLNVNGEQHIAVLNDPQIPAALAPVIAGLRQLHDWKAKPLYHPIGAFRRDSQNGGWHRVSGPESVPELTTTDGGSTYYEVGPQDWYTIYNSSPLYQAGITGAGSTIAVLEETEVVNQADVTSFRSQFGLPAYPGTPNGTQGGVNWIYGPGNGCSAPPRPTSTDEESEALLDVEWAGAVAPQAIVDFVACTSTGSGIGSYGTDLAASYVANYLYSTVVATSLSYGECELQAGSGTAYYGRLWQQLSAEGITAVVSAGDAGSLGCDQNAEYASNNLSTNALSSSIYNISAGGTDFSDAYQTRDYATQSARTWWSGSNGAGYGSALSYVPEIAWEGFCSSPLFASYLEATGNSTFGTNYSPLAICNSTQAGTSYEDLVAPQGGSGGISLYNLIPSWQGGVYGIGNTATSTTYRNEPDLSFFASNGRWGHFLPYCQSDTGEICNFSSGTDAASLGAGGTSFVAPQIAGLMALVNQQTGSRQGLANYTLYNLASAEYGTPGNPNSANLSSCSGSANGAEVGTTCIFRDVAGDTPSLQGGTITSDIVQPCLNSAVTNCYDPGSQTYGLSAVGSHSSTLAYQTAPGYDLATGLGSVNVYNLVMEWNTAATFASTTSLSASPLEIISPIATVNLTATVAATGRGGQVAPVGTVSFYIGSTSGTLLGTTNLSSTCSGAAGNTICTATAALAVQGSQLNSGSNNIIAYFAGDGANDAPSTSSAVAVAYALGADLTISKSHVGNFMQGQSGAAYTLAVSNIGGAASSGAVTVTDTLPTGLTATAISGTGWSCTLGTLSCTRSDVLNSLSNYPPVTLTVTVAGNAPATVTNTATVSGGGDANSANNTASDATTILLAGPDLTITKSHVGNFVQGQTGSYTLAVGNVGGTASSGAVTVTDTLPAGLTAVAIGGTGWSCTLSPLSCTRSDAVNSLNNYPPITLTVSVASTAPNSVTNTATVAGGGDVNTANNSASDTTTILTPVEGTIITTWAGNGLAGYTGDGGQAINAELDGPEGTAADAAGNVYFADTDNNCIRKVAAATGVITTVAGTGAAGYSGDGGPATSADLYQPNSVVVDAAGNLLIADTMNNRIRKVNAATGIITTVAGSGSYGYAGDGGAATSASISLPQGLAVDEVGNIYFSDTANQRVRVVSAATGLITTFAGNASCSVISRNTCSGGDGGPAVDAELSYPLELAVDGAGNLYIDDWGNNLIRKVNAATGIITTAAGIGVNSGGYGGYAGDGGLATSALLNFPTGIALDPDGNLYIADQENNRIRAVNGATGIINTVAGDGLAGSSGDGGPATSAELSSPTGVSVDVTGNLYIGDWANNRIRKVVALSGSRFTTTTTLTASAGTAAPASAVTLAAKVTASSGLTPGGYVVFSDTTGPIGSAELDNTGATQLTTSSLAIGSHSITALYSGDSSDLASTSASLPVVISGNAPAPVLISISPSSAYAGGSAFALTVSGSDFVSTSTVMWNGSSRPTIFAGSTQLVAAIPASDIAAAGSAEITVSTPAPGGGLSSELSFAIQGTALIKTVAGNGFAAYSGDGGLATAAEIYYPGGVAADSAGNFYIADTDNNRIRKVSAATGVITTVAGNGTPGYSGDGGLAVNAQLYWPIAVKVDAAGNLYITDFHSNRIRKVTAATGVITTVAGNGAAGYNGDGGLATNADLNSPVYTAVDAAGNLYIADRDNYRIRKVSATTGVITTVAGNGSPGTIGDGGPATSAELYFPEGVAVDAAGNLYIDEEDSRVREVNAITGVIKTVAGGGNAGLGDGGPATSAELNRPIGIVVDTSGNLYISDFNDNRIRFVNAASGLISTVAGNGGEGYSGDGGPAITAELYAPPDVAIDAARNIYIADMYNQRIREVSGTVSSAPAPVLTSVSPSGVYAGAGAFTLTVNGSQFVSTSTVLWNGGARTTTYLSSTQLQAAITAADVASVGTATITVSTPAPGGGVSSGLNFSIQAPPAPALTSLIPNSAYAGSPAFSLTLNGSNFVGSSTVLWNGSARTTTYLSSTQLQAAITAADIAAAGTATITVSTPAPGGGVSNGLTFTIQPPPAPVLTSLAPSSAFAGGAAFGLTVNGSNFVGTSTVLWNGSSRSTIFVSSTQLQATITAADIATAGTATVAVSTPAPGGGISNGLAFTIAIQTAATISTVAGDGIEGYGGDGGAAVAAELYDPDATAVDASGNMYIVDAGNNRIRKVSAATGLIATIAGNGSSGFGGDGGPATSAEFDAPSGLALDSAGNLYVADTNNYRIRKINASTGIITTVVGGGSGGDGGPAANAQLSFPLGVAIDAAGNLYISDYTRVRKVTAATGVISTVAGNGTLGYSGDGGLATSAEVYIPYGVAIDVSGNLFIADWLNNRVRKVTASTGIITTVAGNGIAGYSGDGGLATAAELSSSVYGVTVDSAGNLYIADTGNQRIRMVTSSAGVITTVVGDGVMGYSGDGGPPANATLDWPYDVVLDAAGNMYIADSFNSVIRKVTPLTQPKITPLISWTTPVPITYGTNLNGVLNATASYNGSPVAGSFSYTANGTAVTTSTVLSAGEYPLTAVFTPADTTTYSSGQTASVLLMVIQATPVISWASPAPITYGSDLSNVLNPVASFGGNPLPGSFSYATNGAAVTSSTVLAAGTYTIEATFTPADTIDYRSKQTASISLTVNQAVPVISWASPAPIAYGTSLSGILDPAASYNGNSLSGSFSYTANGEAVNSSTVLAVGTYTLMAIFTPADITDYRGGQFATVSLIVQGTPVISWSSPAPVAYGSGLSTVLNPVASYSGNPVPGSFAFTANGTAITSSTVLAVGAYTLVATFTPSDSIHYRGGETATVSLIVTQATPVISWTPPAAISFGMGLSGILNATASSSGGPVTGSFSYTANGVPVTGATILPMGTYRLVATFSPADATDYHGGETAAVSLTINQATPAISWTPPAAIPYGSNLSSVLNATANVSGYPVGGTFTYKSGSQTVTASTVLAAGAYTLVATFRPADSADYSAGQTATASLTVNQATPEVQVVCAAGIIYNGAAHACKASATGVNGAAVSGSFAWTPAVSETNAGSYTMTATLTSSNPNYTGAAGSASLVIAGKVVTAKVKVAGKVYDGTDAATISSCTVSGLAVQDIGKVTCSATAASFFNVNAGSQPATVTGISLGGPAAGNYALSSTTESVSATISRASQSLAVSCPGPFSYSGAAHSCTISGGFGTCTSASVTNVPGSSSLTLKCTGDANHEPWSGKGAIVITPVTPVISGCLAVTSPYNLAASPASILFNCTVTPSLPDLKMIYTVTGPAALSPNSIAPTAVVFTGPGTVTVTASVTARTNSTAATWSSGAITVVNTTGADGERKQ
jgi:uncharacterized repeat protein (TIGR01451 family)